MSFLNELDRSLTVGQVQAFLAAQLDAKAILIRAAGNPLDAGQVIRPDMTVGELLERYPEVVLQIHLAVGMGAERTVPVVAEAFAGRSADRLSVGNTVETTSYPFRRAASSPGPFRPTEEHSELVVREIDRLERQRARPFIWIGYLIKQRLPALFDCDASDARMLMAAVQRQGLITTSQVPNPKNPSFPATEVRLNRENPEVARMLGGAHGGIGNDSASQEPSAEPDASVTEGPSVEVVDAGPAGQSPE
ncbi:MAG: hypothetical protein JXQ73_02340 [Phycisphaerae bacterium]|nr:hypothetical protein [Phycisphaerae bacterium]